MAFPSLAPLRLARPGAPVLHVSRRSAARAPAAAVRRFTAARPGGAAPRGRRGLAPLAAAGVPEPPPGEPREKGSGANPGELLTKKVVASSYDKESAQRVLDQLKKLGADDPAKLQKLFVRRGLTRLYPRAVRPRRRESRALSPPHRRAPRAAPRRATRHGRTGPASVAPRGRARFMHGPPRLQHDWRKPLQRALTTPPAPRGADIRRAQLQRRVGRLPGLRAVEAGALSAPRAPRPGHTSARPAR
jgi:hypothetical protein